MAPDGRENGTMRPAYPQEQAPPMEQRGQEDWAAYPDLVYRAARQPEEEESIPWQQHASWAAGGTPRKQRKTALWAFVALCAFAVLCLLLYAVYSLRAPETLFEQKAAIVNRNVIAQGVKIDGVHVGGLTKEEALLALSQGDGPSAAGGLQITVQVDGDVWSVTNRELPLERSLSAALDTAYAVGRQGTPETIATSTTPFEYRYQHLYHTVLNPVNISTAVTYDPARVREVAYSIAAQVNRDPVDAQVATFDFNTRSFTFTQDRAGRSLDGETLYAALTDALNRRDYAARIALQSQTIQPRVRAETLMQSFALISSYKTQTTSDANRNNNIDLACRAVMGTAVMPGETFSFNKATGQRTEEKGYLPAAAIQGGATVDEVGGGVCQVSSTLFNAAAMADMTILSRAPHTWPSNYVDKGRDATVNWPNLDFSFRNDRDTPVFIVAYYRQRECTVELYGGSLGPGVSIELETRLVSTEQPPAEPIYENNPLLPPGTVQEKKKARTGYVVETYKVYRRNGAEYSRELLCTSRYQMIQQVLEYN